MKPDTQNPQKAELDHEDLTPTELFGILSAERRQRALIYLAQKPAAIYLGDLAEYIALKEGEPTRERYERISVDLHHCHLPHLCGAGLVDYDAETELLELDVDRSLITPYLQLTEYTA